MYLLIAIEIFLIFPVLFVKRFIYPYTSVAPASSASGASTALYECRSFGLRRPFHNCLAVLVKEVQILLAVRRLSVVLAGELILQVNFHISMLGAALPQKSVGKVALFGVLMCD